MGADIYGTMEEMLIEFCTECYGRMKRESINCAKDARVRERKLYFILFSLQNNRFPNCSKNEKFLDCPFKCMA